jgi:hypothetical protein
LGKFRYCRQKYHHSKEYTLLIFEFGSKYHKKEVKIATGNFVTTLILCILRTVQNGAKKNSLKISLLLQLLQFPYSVGPDPDMRRDFS